MNCPTSIASIDFYRARSNRSIPIADATHTISEISFVVTRITLANGITGDSYLLSFHYSPHAIKGALFDARALAIGADASQPTAFVQAFDREAGILWTQRDSSLGVRRHQYRHVGCLGQDDRAASLELLGACN